MNNLTGFCILTEGSYEHKKITNLHNHNVSVQKQLFAMLLSY